MSAPGTRSPFKPDTLQGVAAFVTGGSSGIGLEIARQLGLHGARVAISGRRQGVLDKAREALQAEGITVLTLQGDVRKPESCAAWMRDVEAEWGGLDVLVNCAAGNFLAAAEDLSVNGFKAVMDTDAVGTFSASRAAFPLLCRSRAPAIINISMTLHLTATLYQVHASAAKAAVDSLTRSLALEWGPHGIRVNGVAPGPIQGTAGMSKLGPGDMAKEVPLGRMGESLDVALAVLFLVSPAASYVSGTTLLVDGASWLWRPSWVTREQVGAVARAAEARSRQVGIAQAAQLRSKL